MTTKVNEINGVFEGRILPITLKFSIPFVISLSLSYVYVIVDTVFIAYIDKNSTALLSGTGLIYPIYIVLLTIGKGLMVGVGALVARGIGERNQNIIKHIADSGLLLSMIISLVVLVFGFMTGAQLIGFLAGAQLSDQALGHAMDYYYYLLPGLVITPLVYALFGVLQGEGLVKYIAISAAISCVMNIGLDAMFIFGFQMGVKGAGLASTVSQIFSLVFLILLFMRKKVSTSVSWQIENVRKKHIQEIIRIGFPECVALFSVVIFYLFTNNLVSSISEVSMNAWVMVNRIDQILMIPVFAVSGATITMVGQNYGRENFERIRAIFKVNLIFGILMVFCLAIIYNLIAPVFYGLLSNNPAVVKGAVLQVRFISLGYIASLGLAMSASVFQATGKPMPAFILRALWSAMVIPMVYVAVKYFNYQMIGIFICMISVNYLDFLLALVWTCQYLKLDHRMKHIRKQASMLAVNRPR